MKPIECEFEAEAVAAAIQGRYPGRLDAQLSAHIAGCAFCTDLATAASAIESMREEGGAEAVIPDSGRVWWLAQLRARREAAETAASPITAAQVIAFALGTGLVGAFFGATSAWFQSAVRWFTSLPFAEAEAIVSIHSLLTVGAAAVLFLVPLAVYLAMGRD